MKTNSFVTAVLAFAAVALVTDAVQASCESKRRVSHTGLDCMHAWWDNSPGWMAAGYSAGSESFCNPYIKNMKAKVDVRNLADRNFYMTGNQKVRGSSDTGKVRKISCCHDYGPCWKDEVSWNSQGEIHWRKSNTSTMTDGWAKVNTCGSADKFCKSGNNNTETWYCKNKWPDQKARDCSTYNCGGDHYCDVDDCTSKWDDSEASETCSRPNTITHDGTRWPSNCTVQGTICEGSDPTIPGVGTNLQQGLTIAVYRVDNLVNCAGRLKDEDDCDEE